MVVVSGLAYDAANLVVARVRACLGIAATGARLAHGAGLAVVVFGAGGTDGARLGTVGRVGSNTTDAT